MATQKFKEFKRKILTKCFEESERQEASILLTALFGEIDQTQRSIIDSPEEIIRYLKPCNPVNRLLELQCLIFSSDNHPEQQDLQYFTGPVASNTLEAHIPELNQYGVWKRPYHPR